LKLPFFVVIPNHGLDSDRELFRNFLDKTEKIQTPLIKSEGMLDRAIQDKNWILPPRRVAEETGHAGV
jgi:hypothetical protein